MTTREDFQRFLGEALAQAAQIAGTQMAAAEYRQLGVSDFEFSMVDEANQDFIKIKAVLIMLPQRQPRSAILSPS